MRQVSLALVALLTIAYCKTADQKKTKKTDIKKELPDVKSVTAEDEKSIVPLTEKENEDKLTFFQAERARGEVFRIFVSSDEFSKQQYKYQEKVSIKDDVATDRELCEELKKTYDKIDYKAQAILKIDLYPDSGTISRVRFLRPTGLSEMDKLISEDVSRLQFEFADEKNIDPIQFKITYMIMLRKRMTREEAMQLLKKHVK